MDLGSDPAQEILGQILKDRLFGAEVIVESAGGKTTSIHDLAYVGGVHPDRAEDVPSGGSNGGPVLLLRRGSLFRGAVLAGWGSFHVSDWFLKLIHTVYASRGARWPGLSLPRSAR